MAALTRAALKALWIAGYTPTESDYDDNWDSQFNLTDDTADDITGGSTNGFVTSGTSTSNTITFANYTTYHSTAAGAGLTGNITLDVTSAVIGATAVLRHNDSSAPTVSGATVRELQSLANNYVTSSNNELIFTVWQDANGDKFVFFNMKAAAQQDYGFIYFDAAAMAPSTTNGATAATDETGATVKTIDWYYFSTSTELSVHAKAPLPLDYESAGTIKAKFYWSDEAASSGNATWGISGCGLPNDTALTAAFGTEITVTDTLTAAQDMCVTAATAAITPSGSAVAGDMVDWKIVMKTSSTLTSGVGHLAGVLLQYQKSTSVVSAW